MDIFAGDPAEIVPCRAQSLLDPVGSLSGNAARRFARPMRCAGSKGPNAAGHRAAIGVVGSARIRYSVRPSNAASESGVLPPPQPSPQGGRGALTLLASPGSGCRCPYRASRIMGRWSPSPASRGSGCWSSRASPGSECRSPSPATRGRVGVGYRQLRVRQRSSRTRRAVPAGRGRHGNPPARRPCRSPARTPDAMRSSARPSAFERRSERADDAILLLEKLHQIDAAGRPGRRTACHQSSAALHRQQRAGPGVGADMLEYDVDALLAGEPRTTPSNRSVR